MLTVLAWLVVRSVFGVGAFPPSILWRLLWLTVLNVPFMLINAPAEELVFRGYGMEGISGRWGSFAGAACTSLLFWLQHVLFSPSAPGMLAQESTGVDESRSVT